MKVSILLLTLDRTDLTKRCVDACLSNCGYTDTELLVCDNGSTEAGMLDYLSKLSTAYFRMNGVNRGIGPMYNQLLLRATGDAFCIIDPDILLPQDWLRYLVDYHSVIPESGISGIHAGAGPEGELRILSGLTVQQVVGVFGTKFFSRKLLDRIGYFCEDYAPYGLEDSDYAIRATAAGFTNYYLGHLRSEHLGNDVHDETPYRMMKWKSLEDAQPKYEANIRKYVAGSPALFIPAPMMR